MNIDSPKAVVKALLKFGGFLLLAGVIVMAVGLMERLP